MQVITSTIYQQLSVRGISLLSSGLAFAAIPVVGFVTLYKRPSNGNSKKCKFDVGSPCYQRIELGLGLLGRSVGPLAALSLGTSLARFNRVAILLPLAAYGALGYWALRDSMVSRRTLLLLSCVGLLKSAGTLTWEAHRLMAGYGRLASWSAGIATLSLVTAANTWILKRWVAD